jgi:hypothetical protein
MARSGIIAWLALILVVVAGALAPSASAAAPTIERINIDDTFTDDILTEECGVPVTIHAQGFIIVRMFSGERTGPAQLTTLNVTVTATATSGGNSVTVKDVGGDLERVEPDGTAVLSIFGQVPFEFAGVLKIDLETDEVILEPQHIVDVEEICATLTA